MDTFGHLETFRQLGIPSPCCSSGALSLLAFHAAAAKTSAEKNAAEVLASSPDLFHFDSMRNCETTIHDLLRWTSRVWRASPNLI